MAWYLLLRAKMLVASPSRTQNPFWVRLGGREKRMRRLHATLLSLPNFAQTAYTDDDHAAVPIVIVIAAVLLDLLLLLLRRRRRRRRRPHDDVLLRLPPDDVFVVRCGCANANVSFVAPLAPLRAVVVGTTTAARILPLLFAILSGARVPPAGESPNPDTQYIVIAFSSSLFSMGRRRVFLRFVSFLRSHGQSSRPLIVL